MTLPIASQRTIEFMQAFPDLVLAMVRASLRGDITGQPALDNAAEVAPQKRGKVQRTQQQPQLQTVAARQVRNKRERGIRDVVANRKPHDRRCYRREHASLDRVAIPHCGKLRTCAPPAK